MSLQESMVLQYGVVGTKKYEKYGQLLQLQDTAYLRNCLYRKVWIYGAKVWRISKNKYDANSKKRASYGSITVRMVEKGIRDGTRTGADTG